MTGRPRLALIAAVAENGVIGHQGAMPWKLPSDLRRFKALTMGHRVIMGRKTYASIGRPLPGRHFIVVTRDPAFRAEGVKVARSLDEALAIARADEEGDEFFVIGGGEIYAASMSHADRLYVTHVAARPEGDAFFPEISPDEWRFVSEEKVPRGDADSAATRFAVYHRIR